MLICLIDMSIIFFRGGERPLCPLWIRHWDYGFQYLDTISLNYFWLLTDVSKETKINLSAFWTVYSTSHLIITNFLEYAFGYLDANSVFYCGQMAVVTMETWIDQSTLQTVFSATTFGNFMNMLLDTFWT